MTEGIGMAKLGGSISPCGTDENYAELAAAVIRQAVRDYETVLEKLFHKPSGNRREQLEMEQAKLEVFFRSPWYAALTEIDGERLIEMARRHALEKEKAAIRRRHRKKMKEMGKPYAPAADNYAPQKGVQNEGRKEIK